MWTSNAEMRFSIPYALDDCLANFSKTIICRFRCKILHFIISATFRSVVM